ncbi:MAG TPA: 2-dehydropantoate 2-reductase [Usitatibacteraceae bacterium]|nr:2-dehydropantoate 2-reductase [Usitatibacteraceae bacterium]
MRFCIVGAGAIGGFVGAKLALAGEDVTFIARGRNLEAINARGMHVYYRDGREEIATTVRATDDYAAAGAFDVVILAIKAHQVGSVAGKLVSLFGPDTVVIPMQNGIPFWYFHDHGGELAGRTIETVDPGGVVKDTIAKERIVGCVVYPAAELVEPGKVVHIEGDRFPIGELDGTTTERATRISEAFTKAGLKCPILENVRAEMWLKLWGNLTFNPISALTHATLQDICEHPHGRALAAQMMGEAQAVAEKLGITFRVPLDKRIEGARKVGKHKTSMLQDVEAGRPIEIDALVGSVVEMGEIAGVPVPAIKAIFQAAKLLDTTYISEAVSIRAVQTDGS